MQLKKNIYVLILSFVLFSVRDGSGSPRKAFAYWRTSEEATLEATAALVVEGQFKVYNFTVEDYHTYYVSQQNILVHNGNPCEVFFGTNMITKFRTHAAEIIAAARNNGISLPNGISKEATQEAFKDYMQTVVKKGKSYVSEYMTMGDVIWSKYGNSIVIRKLDGKFITHLTTSTTQGLKTLKHFEEVVSQSIKAIPLTN